ncbi:MAG TPA: SRPBCC family protein [bacterium]
MRMTGNIQITLPTDLEIAMTREFNAPRKLVYEALVTPSLLTRWLLGPPGWIMTKCLLDPRVGGKYRYEWKNEGDGSTMGMGGTFTEVVAGERLVATELFDEAWYPGEGHVAQTLREQAGKTTLHILLRYESKDARDGVLKIPMDQGMEASYVRLDAMLAEMQTQGGKR